MAKTTLIMRLDPTLKTQLALASSRLGVTMTDLATASIKHTLKKLEGYERPNPPKHS